MAKLHKKEMSKLFFQNISTTTVWWNAPKCDFEEIDTECSTGNNFGFWVLWGIFKEFIKQNIIMAVSRKESYHSVAICRLIKKSIMKKKMQREKLTQNFGFSQAA